MGKDDNLSYGEWLQERERGIDREIEKTKKRQRETKGKRSILGEQFYQWAVQFDRGQLELLQREKESLPDWVKAFRKSEALSAQLEAVVAEIQLLAYELGEKRQLH